jgi:hypothetical protein
MSPVIPGGLSRFRFAGHLKIEKGREKSNRLTQAIAVAHAPCGLVGETLNSDNQPRRKNRYASSDDPEPLPQN